MEFFTYFTVRTTYTHVPAKVRIIYNVVVHTYYYFYFFQNLICAQFTTDLPNDRQNQSYAFFLLIFVWQKRVAVKKELCHKTEVQKLDDFLIDLSSNAYILCHYDFCQN